MTPLVFTKSTGWYGAHSGYYEQLPRQLAAGGARAEIMAPRRTAGARLLGKLLSWRRGYPPGDQARVAACWRFARRARRRAGPDAPAVLLALEEQLAVLDFWPSPPAALVGTIHFPPALWSEAMRAQARRLRSAVVLYRRDLAAFEALVGRGRVRFVPHGVDTEFFAPPSAPPAPGEVLVVGQFLRDWGAVAAVADALAQRRPTWRITVVAPRHACEHPDLAPVRARPSIVLRHGLSDAELLALYQRAYVALLPFHDYAASNAVVECLACGLPVLTYDNGGIRDYGGGETFPLAAHATPAALLALLEQYAAQPAWRAAISGAMRAFAVAQLAWPRVARAHLAAWAALAAGDDAPAGPR